MKKTQRSGKSLAFLVGCLMVTSVSLSGCGSKKSDDSSSPPPAAELTEAEKAQAEGLKLMQTYCGTCHAAAKKAGGVQLADQADAKAKSTEAQSEMSDSSMPPEGAKQPSADEKQKLVAYFKGL